MDSRVRRASAVLMVTLAACATTRAPFVAMPATGGLPDGSTVPLLHPLAGWDDAFSQLVERCHLDGSSGPSITGDVIFTAGWLVLTLGIGALIFSSKQVDSATVLAGSVGVIAGGGEAFTLVRSVMARGDAQRDRESQRRDWLAQWRAAAPPQRTLLLQAVAESCNEQDALAQDVNALGGFPAPPPVPTPEELDGGA